MAFTLLVSTSFFCRRFTLCFDPSFDGGSNFMLGSLIWRAMRELEMGIEHRLPDFSGGTEYENIF
jgi:hypothetical protein